MEGTCRGHLVQPPAQTGPPSSRLSRTTSRWLLKISKGGDSTTTLENLFDHPHSTEVLPDVHMEFLVFWFVSLVLVLGTTEKSLGPSSLNSQVFISIAKIPPSLFSRLDGPNSLSLSSQETLQYLHHLCRTLSITSRSLLYWGDQRWIQHSKHGFTSAD